MLYASILAGCGRIAMTADKFRLQQAGSVETIEINRPLRDVAATFRDRAPACLQDVGTTNIMVNICRVTGGGEGIIRTERRKRGEPEERLRAV